MSSAVEPRRPRTPDWLAANEDFRRYVLERLRDDGYLAGLSLGRWYPDLADGLTVAVTERRTRAEIDGLAAAVKKYLAGPRT